MKYTKEFTNTKQIRVAIGIQARSTSTRFPQKVFQDVCGKPLLQWVVDAAKESAQYISRPNMSRMIDAKVYILTPKGDPIKEKFFSSAQIVEGDEHDVLSRYKALLDISNADYIVRLTGDCPLIPPPVITKAINVAVINSYDYVSNVDERLRLSFDGMDCEVLSSNLLRYLDKHCWAQKDREHVTLMARRKLPDEFTTAHIVGYLDLSGIKLSVDTPEDLEAVRQQKGRVMDALRLSESISGPRNTHRF
jgi:spore coat polysaccharide biosynthesis protein SpsF (cytidylyltransferase family)